MGISVSRVRAEMVLHKRSFSHVVQVLQQRTLECLLDLRGNRTNNPLSVASGQRTMTKPYSVSGTRKIKVEGTNTAVLTVTSKMPGPSFSLPAGEACPNSHGSICGSCYATKGCYRYASTQTAQSARYTWVRSAMKTPESREQWVRTMVLAIRASKTEYFRGHDSGDFFNVAYVEAWTEVARRMPDVKFWFPTREYQAKASTDAFVVLNPRTAALQALAALPNVTVRPSALEVGDAAPVVPGLAAGSAVANAEAF